jgi:hypothetical protein
MPPFLIALVIVVGGFWLIKNSSKLPALTPAFMQKMAGAGLMAFSGLLLLRGEINVAMGLFVFGMGLYGKSALFPNGMNFGQAAGSQTPPPASPPRKGSMSTEEALQVLGLKAGSTIDEIKQTHKRLIKDFHPDKGGSDYLASKINEAKDVLLRG